MKRALVLSVLFPFFLLLVPPPNAMRNFPVLAQAIPDGLGLAHAGSFTDSVYEAWIARYNGPGNSLEDATTVVIDGSGDVYITGLSGGDCVTIKYSSSGQELWVVRYDGAGSSGDWANALALDDSGNVYVTGYTSVGTASDYLTIKYDALGQEEWVAPYNGPGDYFDESNAVAVDDMGNVYVTGYSFGAGTTGDYATIKYDLSGQVVWVARYNGPGNGYDEAIDLAVDSSGNVYVTGYSPGSGSGLDYATIKYNDSGQLQWVSRYDGPGSGPDYAYDLVVDGSGEVYVAGLSEGDYATIKYDASGQEKWDARYDGGYFDHATALAVDGSGNVFVTGYSADLGTSEDFATIRYDSAGNEQWVARYNGPEDSVDHATAVAIDGSGGVYVTGYSTGSNTENDYATIKYNFSGEQQWVIRYDAAGSDDRGTALAVDTAGNVYVTGLSIGAGTNYDFATIKYGQEIQTTVGPGGVEVPLEYSLGQNFPNPFNPSTTINFSVPRPGDVRLKIFNMLGEQVASLISGYREIGTYSVQWDATGQPSGVYFYRLSTNGFVQTRKLVLLR